MFDQTGSRRWMHFQSALQLAIQRSARKWTFEDFAECFPLYVEEEKNAASVTFNIISDFIEKQDRDDITTLFEKYGVQGNIDILHNIVTEAKARKEKGEISKDVWREDLQPRGAVCARTIPVLETEAARLRETLAQLEDENRHLQTQLEENIKTKDEADIRTLDLLQKLEDTYTQWEKLPMDAIEDWTVQTANALKSSNPH
ncbi:hypothetical protein P691DRAFT_658248 [Macrolepiota fuliginosa MF-IS2]|uniref:Uncharacterized protein n=1 Tax=Macrolepiota fuliginosa MF-IS2 TaxID=1400762 RepID=A0A9P6C6G2_9AGAR|nr:hypothetical protein P691DRAFT_658248 [Macrolepiota fuliginosa MF-IS2]